MNLALPKKTIEIKIKMLGKQITLPRLFTKRKIAIDESSTNDIANHKRRKKPLTPEQKHANKTTMLNNDARNYRISVYLKEQEWLKKQSDSDPPEHLNDVLKKLKRKAEKRKIKEAEILKKEVQKNLLRELKLKAKAELKLKKQMKKQLIAEEKKKHREQKKLMNVQTVKQVPKTTEKKKHRKQKTLSKIKEEVLPEESSISFAEKLLSNVVKEMSSSDKGEHDVGVAAEQETCTCAAQCTLRCQGETVRKVNVGTMHNNAYKHTDCTGNTMTDTICTHVAIDYNDKPKRRRVKVVKKSNQSTTTDKQTLVDVSTITGDWWSPIVERKKNITLEKKTGDYSINQKEKMMEDKSNRRMSAKRFAPIKNHEHHKTKETKRREIELWLWGSPSFTEGNDKLQSSQKSRAIQKGREKASRASKWNGKEYDIPEFSPSDSVAMLKIAIENATGVRPDRQKLLNVKFQDNYTLAELNLKPNLKIMMMGSLEEAIQGALARPECGDDVVNDLDLDDEEVDYSSKNTIMFDDIRRNFIMNPKSGLKIRPFRQAHLNRDKDRELVHLSTYLLDIAQYCDDFDTLNHKKWEKYKPDRKSHSASKRKAEDSSPSSHKE
ncbi:hypothetical protein MSG28_014287 [Choristoneura fumiferana]|uniref:Uncharacterized protein n=1 Tax=Choristoneura fumiferana TaxID=7141 RepID=A0ACC0JGL7_CHOFU|nr:hypothetical protein MSG28_014287 [Choristoneura fumiferana]